MTSFTNTALLSETGAHQPGAHTHVHINFVGQHQDWDAWAELAQLVIPPAGDVASICLGPALAGERLLKKGPPTGASNTQCWPADADGEC